MDAAASPEHPDGLVRTVTPNGSLAWAPPAQPGQQDPPLPTTPSSSLNLKRARSPGQQAHAQGQQHDDDDVDAEGEPDVPSNATPAVTASVDQHPPLNDAPPAGAAGPAGPTQAEHDDGEPSSKRPRRAAAQASARATRQLSKQQRGDSSSDEDEEVINATDEGNQDIAVDNKLAPAPPPPVKKEPKPKPERKKPGPRIHKLPKSALAQQQQHQIPPPTLDLAIAPGVPGAGPLVGDLAVLDPVAGPSGTAGDGAPGPAAPLAPPPEPIIAHLVPVQPSDGEMPERTAYDKAVDDYILSLHPIKRNKALMTDALHDLVLKILIEPQNTQLGDPQLRFWVRQRFTLLEQPEGKYVLHDYKKVVLKDALWETIASAHAETKHGGRDKTYAAVKKGWSYVPKEVVTVFVKLCPTCGGKRATERKSTGPREKKPKEPKAEGLPTVLAGADGQDIQARAAAAQQLRTAESGNAVAGPSSSTDDATAALVAALGASHNSHALNMRASFEAGQAGPSGEKGAGYGQNGVGLLPQPSQQGQQGQQQQSQGPAAAAFLPLPQQAHNGPPLSSLLAAGAGQAHQHPMHPMPLYAYHPHAQHQHPQHQLPPPQQSHPHTLPLPPAQYGAAQYHPYTAHPDYPPLPMPPPPQP